MASKFMYLIVHHCIEEMVAVSLLACGVAEAGFRHL